MMGAIKSRLSWLWRKAEMDNHNTHHDNSPSLFKTFIVFSALVYPV